jgi:uncharacterized protein (DUF302 family)
MRLMDKFVSRRRLIMAGAVTALAATAAHAADEQTMTKSTAAPPTVTSRTIPVEHIRIASHRPFADVRQRLESTVPQLDPGIVEALDRGDQERARDYDANGPKLSIFLIRDHGALLQVAGGKKDAVQYEIGNPLTASKMTRHLLPAALYAPLRVVLFADEQGRGIFEYDKPSSLFGQFGDERVTAVSRDLDTALEAALRHAAE